MKRIVSMFLVVGALVAVPLAQGHAASKTQNTFCKIRPYASANAILGTLAAVGGTLKLTRATLQTMMYIELERLKFSRNAKAVTVLDNKAFIKLLGLWKPLRFFGKTLIPFMSRHKQLMGDMNKLIKRNQRGQYAPSRPTQLNQYYQAVKKVEKIWGWTVKKPLLVLFATTLAVCKEAKLIVWNVCLKKKKSCSLEEEDALVYDAETGELVGAYAEGACSSSDDQRARKLLQYANSQEKTINKTLADIKKVHAFLKKYGPHAKRFNSAVKPVVNPAKKAAKALKSIGKVITPGYKVLGELQKVMERRICIKYKVPGTKKVCTKKKVLGKKKKFCVKKPTFKTKKSCTRVKNAIRDVGKAASVIQKPLELALKKTIDPIIKKLVKKIPGVPKKKDFEKFYRALQGLAQVSKMMTEIKALGQLPLASHNASFKRMRTKLKSWQ